MSLRFLDTWDHYTTITHKWTAQSGGSIIAAALRTGIAGLRLTASQYVVVTLDPQGTWIVGVAFRVSAAAALSIIRTWDVGADQGVLRLNADRTLSLLRGAVVVATSVNQIALNTWYYLEFRHVIDPAAGTLEVRVNEAVWATFAGNTRATANSTANQILLQGPAGNADFDDLYVLDGTGAAPNNTYWGDTHIEALVPSGAGTYTEWATLVGAGTHWQAVSEVPPNDDGSYVADNIIGARDTFALGNLSVISAQINGVQVLVRGREDAAGGVTLARMLRRAGVDSQGADVKVNTSHAYWIREVIETDPIAAAPWTVDAINNLELGVRVRP